MPLTLDMPRLNMNTDDVALAAGSTLMLIRAVRRRAAGLAKTGDTETQFALGAIDYSMLGGSSHTLRLLDIYAFAFGWVKI